MDDRRLQKEIGRRIATTRKQLKLTQENLSNATGLSTQTISSAENGRKALRPENIVKICESLNISADYLLCGEATSLSDLAGAEQIKRLTPKQREALVNIVRDYLQAFEE